MQRKWKVTCSSPNHGQFGQILTIQSQATAIWVCAVNTKLEEESENKGIKFNVFPGCKWNHASTSPIDHLKWEKTKTFLAWEKWMKGVLYKKGGKQRTCLFRLTFIKILDSCLYTTTHHKHLQVHGFCCVHNLCGTEIYFASENNNQDQNMFSEWSFDWDKTW